jgi:uncharacterized protein YbjT (DUF2867 family)
LIDAAKSAGIQHFVYTSAYSFGKEYDSIPFYQFKRRVEQYLRTSGLNYTILRPTLFMESHAEMAIGRSVLEKGQVMLFGRGENPRNFVSADDVAQFVVMALEGSELNGKTVDIGGPEDLTNMDVIRVYEELAGREAIVHHVPLWKLQVKYRLYRLFNAGLSQILQFNLYADTQDSTFDSAPMLAQYPVKLTRLADWARLRVL